MRIIILLIISMGLFLSCGNGKKLPNVGDKVYVVQECPVSYTHLTLPTNSLV